MVLITSDSTADLEGLFGENNIDVLPLIVTLGNEDFYDGVNISPTDIFDFVRTKKILPKTAARNQQDYRNFFEERTKGGNQIVHFTISSSMSASYESARKAAEDFSEVYVVNSKNLSSGIGLLALYASDLAKQGLTAKEIYNKVNERIPYVQTSFVVDTMEYLYKGGRCSGIAKFAASVLRIKPTILVKNGEMVVGKKYMGNFSKSIIKYIQDTLNTFNTPDYTRIFITHTYADPEIVEAVRAEIQKSAPFKQIIETKAGCTVTSHCGKSTLGILYINDGKK